MFSEETRDELQKIETGEIKCFIGDPERGAVWLSTSEARLVYLVTRGWEEEEPLRA